MTLYIPPLKSTTSLVVCKAVTKLPQPFVFAADGNTYRANEDGTGQYDSGDFPGLLRNKRNYETQFVGFVSSEERLPALPEGERMLFSGNPGTFTTLQTDPYTAKKDDKMIYRVLDADDLPGNLFVARILEDPIHLVTEEDARERFGHIIHSEYDPKFIGPRRTF